MTAKATESISGGSFRRLLRVFGYGVLMGAADVVPGVSGGTVALVLGIYQRLIEAIRKAAKTLVPLAKGDFGGSGRV